MKFSEIRQLPTLNGKIQHWNQQQNLPSNSSHAELPDQALPDINGKLLNWFRNHNLPPIPGSCQFLMVNYYSEISIIIYHQIRARSCPNPMVNYGWYFKYAKNILSNWILTPLCSERCASNVNIFSQVFSYPVDGKFCQEKHLSLVPSFLPLTLSTWLQSIVFPWPLLEA